MTFGLLALNDNNEVLISSDTRNLHLVAKCGPPTLTNSSSAYGGFIELTYTVESLVTPVPFFTMPSPSNYHGIAGVKNTTGSTWEIRLIKSGGNDSYPEVYVFADPRAVIPAAAFGMQVFRDDGTPSFDSRLSPLAVTGGTAVVHTSNPRSSIPGLSARYCGSGNTNGGFTPDSENGPYSLASMPAKPMFHYSSLAQAEREAAYYDKDESCTGFDYGFCVGYSTTDEFWSHYWAFYRGGIRRSGNSFYAGWIVVNGGCWWSTYSDSDFIGIGTGSDSGNGGDSPYSNETINLSSAAVIVGDASRYD
jgi:hypothetical protein